MVICHNMDIKSPYGGGVGGLFRLCCDNVVGENRSDPRAFGRFLRASLIAPVGALIYQRADRRDK